MRKCFALVLLAAFSWIGGLGQDARAGVTIDVVFQDGMSHGLTIPHGDPGPGCDFGGYAGGSVSTGYCMDVILLSTYDTIGFGTSVIYDSDNGLALASMVEWKGIGVEFGRSGRPIKSCILPIGLNDDDGSIGQFGCIVPPPNVATLLASGTYRIGTIIWDTSGTTHGSETIAAYINPLFDGFLRVVNGVIDNSSVYDVEVGSAVLHFTPEPGTAALLGIGLVGLTLAARRRRG